MNRWQPCRVFVAAAAALFALRAGAETSNELSWSSPTTGDAVAGRVTVPPSPSSTEKPLATVVYLKNLSIPRLGQDADEAILQDLQQAGHLVLVLDYAKHANAAGPALAADVLKLREDVSKKKLLSDHKVDLSRLFILPEGFRLKRDVEFARDGDRVLAMDIAYPSNPKNPVPVLMEITCDNANRMGTSSLLFCHDTLLEGGTFAGFATAMIDHPVKAPYKGLDDPMPENIHRLKAAVRTLRATGKDLGLSGKIGAVGFSRGSNMAALLTTTGGRADLEGDGLHGGVSSRIQAAMIHGGRFDFTRLRSDDPMLARFEKAWGPRESNLDKWAAHGALHYFNRSDVAPMFLNTSNAESTEFRDQLSLLAKTLKDAGVEHAYSEDADGRGHRVSTDPKTLASAYAFFAKHLGGESAAGSGVEAHR